MSLGELCEPSVPMYPDGVPDPAIFTVVRMALAAELAGLTTSGKRKKRGESDSINEADEEQDYDIIIG